MILDPCDRHVPLVRPRRIKRKAPRPAGEPKPKRKCEHKEPVTFMDRYARWLRRQDRDTLPATVFWRTTKELRARRVREGNDEARKRDLRYRAIRLHMAKQRAKLAATRNEPTEEGIADVED